MVARIRTVAFQGVEVIDVEAQVTLTPGLPAFSVVGLPDKAVAESRERVRGALAALGLALPPRHITVNLAPADVLKEGSHFDLPIALGLLAAMEVLPGEELGGYMAVGELALDGSLTGIAGMLLAELAAAGRRAPHIAYDFPMAKAISYRRFSSGAQATGDSLKRQTEAAQAYCDAYGDELDLTFIDAGVSAYRGKNATQGSLRRLVELAEQGTFEPGTKLIVEHLDRLSRTDVPTAQEQFTRILRSGLTIVTLMDRQEYTYGRVKTDLSALLVPLVLMFNANQESANKGERVAKAKESLRERVRAGKAKMTRQCPFWLRAQGSGEHFQFVPIPERVAVVRRIFELSLTGLGKRSIMTLLNREGVPPFRQGDGWHHSSIGAILRNVSVLGHFRLSRFIDGKVVYTDEVVKDYYPAIVDGATFYRAQEAAEARKEPRAAGRKSIGLGNLFSGLGKCGYCGANLVYETRGERRRKGEIAARSFRFLVCGRAVRHNGCANDHKHPYDPFERGMLNLLTMFDLAQILGKHAEPDAARAAELEAKITGKKAEGDLLLEGWVQSPNTIVQRRIDKLAEEITQLEQQLETHRRQMRIADANRGRNMLAEYTALVRRMREASNLEDRYLMRAKLSLEFKRLVVEIMTDGQDLLIRLKAPTAPVELRLVGSKLTYLPAWDLLPIEEFRMPGYSEDAPHPVSAAND